MELGNVADFQSTRELATIYVGCCLLEAAILPSKEVRTLPPVADIILWVTVMSVPADLGLAILLLVSCSSTCILPCCCPMYASLAPSPLGTNGFADGLRVSPAAKLDIQMIIRDNNVVRKLATQNVTAMLPVEGWAFNAGRRENAITNFLIIATDSSS
jgi:hypothetical protein